MTASTDTPEWVDVTPIGVRREGGDDPEQRKYIMMLEADGGRGRLPIWIGPAEGTALALTLQAVETPRPLTYQLAAGLIEAAGARAAEVRITRLDAGTFYAVVVVDGPAGRHEVDARPSDAVILAAVVNAPIRAEARLFADPVSSQSAWDWESLPTDTADLAAEAKPMLRPPE